MSLGYQLIGRRLFLSVCLSLLGLLAYLCRWTSVLGRVLIRQCHSPFADCCIAGAVVVRSHQATGVPGTACSRLCSVTLPVICDSVVLVLAAGE